MRKLTKEEIERIQNGPIYHAQTQKIYCPKCGEEVITRPIDAAKCQCGWEYKSYPAKKKASDR